MTPDQQQLFERFSQSLRATVMRIGRRITEGFEGEITMEVRKGGVRFIRWTETETGDQIKEELNGR